MQPINELSSVGRKPPEVGALTRPVAHSSCVHPQNLRGQPQPPHQVRPVHAKPQQTLPPQAKPLHVQFAPAQPPQKQPDQNPPKLLDQVRNVLRTKHYSMRTEESYIDWIRRYVLFHNKRHPAEMGEKEISEFLTHLAVKEHVAASTQNQALSAILFLYRQVLKIEIGRLDELTWAKKPETLPVVLSKEEIKAILSHLSGKDWIMTALMYGCGLRVDECVTWRVKDFDFERNQIVVRRGKGEKDRPVPLPQPAIQPLQNHLAKVKKLHDADLKKGGGAVDLPFALDRKYTGLSREFNWQYAFPSQDISRNKISGNFQRHHTSERTVQRAFAKALKMAGITKHAHCHTLRHSFFFIWFRRQPPIISCRLRKIEAGLIWV